MIALVQQEVTRSAGLCSMFNDAASVKAGRLIDRNPFQKLGISRGKGRREAPRAGIITSPGGNPRPHRHHPDAARIIAPLYVARKQM